MTLYLHGLGHFHPENEIDNAFLESLDIGTDNEWILERVGIRSRRTVLPLDYIRGTRNADVRAAAEASLYTAAQVGARAAEMAISRSGIDKAEIGMVIAGSSMPDYATPAEACNIARELGLDVPAFDVNSACTSFLMQIRVLSMMRPEALPPYVLIVVPECATKVVDYNDRATAVLWGDGGAAAVVSARVRGPARLLGATAASNPAGADKVVVPRTGRTRRANVRGAKDGRGLRTPPRSVRGERAQPSLRRPSGKSPHARGRLPALRDLRGTTSLERRMVRQHRSGELGFRDLHPLGRVARERRRRRRRRRRRSHLGRLSDPLRRRT